MRILRGRHLHVVCRGALNLRKLNHAQQLYASGVWRIWDSFRPEELDYIWLHERRAEEPYIGGPIITRRPAALSDLTERTPPKFMDQRWTFEFLAITEMDEDVVERLGYASDNEVAQDWLFPEEPWSNPVWTVVDI